MLNALVNVNGKILDADQAQVSVFDRSYLYGDSLYEVVRTLGGSAIHINEHLDRLERSAELSYIKLGQSREELAAQMLRTIAEFKKLKANSSTDVYCRLIVSRGSGKIGFGNRYVTTGTQYTIIVQPLALPTAEQLRDGLTLKVVQRIRLDGRALSPAIKSGNYLNCVLAYIEGVEKSGFDDAVMCNSDGHVTEGTTFSVGYFKRGIFVTSPLDIGILDSITRRVIIRMCRELSIPVREVRFPKERFYEADEVVWISTTKGIFPVTRVDDQRISKGKPGPLTLRVREEFDAHCKRLAAHS